MILWRGLTAVSQRAQAAGFERILGVSPRHWNRLARSLGGLEGFHRQTLRDWTIHCIRTAIEAATSIVEHQTTEGNNAKGGHAEHKPKLAKHTLRHY